MEIKYRMQRSYFLGIISLVMAMLLLGPAVGLAAQEGEEASQGGGGIPPLPAVYQGQVFVDDILYEESVHELSVKIGDWEGRSVPVVNGSFESLIAGPPDIGYVGLDTTFHLGDLVAVQTIPFAMLTEPSFEPLRLDFKSATDEVTGAEPLPATDNEVAAQNTPPADTPTENALEIPWEVLIMLFSGGAVVVVLLNRLGKVFLK